MLSIPDLGWGSVVGNTLDHGITYLPYGNDMAAQCGMEVVLPNGELMRTGMGAMPGQPVVARLQARPRPDARPALHAVELRHRHEDGRLADAEARVLHAALAPGLERRRPRHRSVDTLRRLMLDRTIENVPQILEHDRARLGDDRSRAPWYEGEDPIPDAVIDTMARELEIGRWMMRFALYGDESVVDLRFKKIKEAFEQIPGAEVWGTKYAPDAVPALEHPIERVQARRSEPRPEPDDRVVRRRAGRPHRLLAGRPAHGPGRPRPARPAARDDRGAGRARLHGRADPHQRAAASST